MGRDQLDSDKPQIFQLLDEVKRGWIFVVAAALLAAAGAYFYFSSRPSSQYSQAVLRVDRGPIPTPELLGILLGDEAAEIAELPVVIEENDPTVGFSRVTLVAEDGGNPDQALAAYIRAADTVLEKAAQQAGTNAESDELDYLDERLALLSAHQAIVDEIIAEMDASDAASGMMLLTALDKAENLQNAIRQANQERRVLVKRTDNELNFVITPPIDPVALPRRSPVLMAVLAAAGGALVVLVLIWVLMLIRLELNATARRRDPQVFGG